MTGQKGGRLGTNFRHDRSFSPLYAMRVWQLHTQYAAIDQLEGRKRRMPVQEAKNLPLVLNVHGGPWARDVWGYRPDVQWFTNRGYAVLQVRLPHTFLRRPLAW